MRRLAVFALLALAGCGGGAPSEVVPADATTYIGVDAGEAERIAAGISRADVDFERDVQPWLGDRAAYFAMTDDESGLVFEIEDEDAAEAFARKVTTAGPLRASAVIDGRLVLTSTPALLRAANASAGGQSLADSTRLDVAGEDEDDAPDILVATGEPRALVPGLELMEVLPDVPPLPVPGDALTARVWSESGHRRIVVSGLPPREQAAPSLADLPRDAWLAAASGDLGEDAALAEPHEQYRQIEALTGLDLERSVLPHLGAGLFFVDLQLGGRLTAEAVDERALRREVVALARRLGPRAKLTAEPFGVVLEEITVTLEDGRLEIESGDPAGDGLDETRAYRDAERRLEGAPTLLLVDDPGYLAARDSVEDGRRVVRIVQTY